MYTYIHYIHIHTSSVYIYIYICTYIYRERERERERERQRQTERERERGREEPKSDPELGLVRPAPLVEVDELLPPGLEYPQARVHRLYTLFRFRRSHSDNPGEAYGSRSDE